MAEHLRENRIGGVRRMALRQETAPGKNGNLPRIAGIAQLQELIDDPDAAAEQDRVRSCDQALRSDRRRLLLRFVDPGKP